MSTDPSAARLELLQGTLDLLILRTLLPGPAHGSRILIADGNYAHRTNSHPRARVIHLNLRPGLLTVDQVLETVAEAVPVEAAAVMAPDNGSHSDAADRYAGVLGGDVPFAALERDDFYAACKSDDVVVVVATGDTRYFANVLLTIGALPES